MYDVDMLNRLYTAAVLISLLVGVLAIALWALSCGDHNSIIREPYLPDVFADASDPALHTMLSFDVIAVIDGEFVCSRTRRLTSHPLASSGWHLFRFPSRELLANDTLLHRLGLSIGAQTTPRGHTIRLMTPMWLVVGLAAILPGWWYFCYERRRALRLRAGSSINCGRDPSRNTNDSAAQPALPIDPTPAIGQAAKERPFHTPRLPSRRYVSRWR